MIKFLRDKKLAAFSSCMVFMIVAPLLPSAASPSAENRIEGIRAGSHGTFSRLVFDLNRDASYEVHLTEENVITVSFSNCTLSDGAKGKSYRDALIKRISCAETLEKEVVADIVLDSQKKSFSHTALTSPPRVVIDIANGRDRSGSKKVSSRGGTHNDAAVAGMPPRAAKTPPAGGEPGNEDQDGAHTADPAGTETKEKLLVGTGAAQDEDLLVSSPATALDLAGAGDGSVDEQVSPGGDIHNDAAVAGMPLLAAKTQPAGGEPGNEDQDGAHTADSAETETKEKLLVGTGTAHEEDLLVNPTTTVSSDPLREQQGEEINPEAKKAYCSALELFDKQRYREALTMLRHFMDNYPRSTLAGAVSLLIGDCYYCLAEEKILTSYQPAIDAFQLALALYADSAGGDRGYFQLANSYRKMGYHLEADENYKLLLETHPESKHIPDAHFWMAENLYQEEAFERARDGFQRYLEKYHEGAWARKAAFRTADCLVGMQEYGKALQSYEDLLSRWPDYSGLFPETLYSMGITYLENGNYQRAQSILFTALNLFPEQEYNHIIMTRIGDAYQMEGKLEQALKVYSQNNVLYPKSEGAMLSEVKMADIGVKNPGFFNFDQYLDPLKVYRQIIEKYPATDVAEQALYKQGVAYSEQRKYQEAIASLQTVLEAYPDSELSKKCLYSLQENLSKLIESYFSEEKYYPVLVLYRKHKDPFLEDSTNTGTLFRIGESFRQVGLYDNALELYEKARRIYPPTHPEDELLFRMGEVYRRKKEYAQAEKLLQKMGNDFPGSRFRTHALHALAETYFEQKSYNQASQAYLAALEGEERTPMQIKGLFYLGKCYQAMENTTLAVDAYRKAIKAGEESGKESQEDEYVIKSYFQLGDCLYQTHQYAEAIEIYARIVERYPDHERTQWALYRLTAGYREVGRKGAEIESLKKLAGQGQKEAFWGKVVNEHIKDLEWEITHQQHLSR